MSNVASLLTKEDKAHLNATGLKVRVGDRQQLIPPGEYKAKVTEIKQGNYRDKRPIFLFTFEVVEGLHKNQQVRGFVNANYASYSAYTKLYQWYYAVTGDELEPGKELDLDDFLGKVLNVVVETKRSRQTKNEFSNVTEIKGVVCEL